LPRLDEVYELERRRPYEQPGVGRSYLGATRGQQCLGVIDRELEPGQYTTVCFARVMRQ
jgi:hypothetical protein